MFLLSYRNTSGSLGEREMLGTASSSSPKLSRVFLLLDRNTANMFSISFRKHRDEQKRKQLINFDYQNVNSLCSRHHYVNSAC